MSDNDKEITALAVPPGLIQQFRQLSVPLWARLLALLLGLGVFLIGLWLLALGTILCGAECNAGFKDAGTAVLSASMIPVLVLVYLAFAETGTKSLKKRTDEILATAIPEAFTVHEPVWAPNDEERAIRSCAVTVKHAVGSPTARYDLEFSWGTTGETKCMPFKFFVDLNVYKVNVGVQLPDSGEFCGDQGCALVQQIFGTTIKGAEHAGYEMPFTLPPEPAAEAANRPRQPRFVSFVARRKLPADFLWDPAEKLHFIFDMRNFVFAFASNWFSHLDAKASNRP